MSSKKARQARQRPANTSQLSNAVSEEVHKTDEQLCAFSQDADYFAILFPVLNKHRLCIYDASTGQAVGEHIPDDGHVTALSWGELLYTVDGSSQNENQSPSKKRKKRSEHNDQPQPLSSVSRQGAQIVLLGLSNGSTELFSPSHGRVVRTLSHPSVNSAVSCARLQHVTLRGTRTSLACIAMSNGDIFTWNASQNIYIGKWSHDVPNEFSTFVFKPYNETCTYLAAGKSISLYSHNNQDFLTNNSVRPQKIGQFNGHTSNIKSLIWESTEEPRRFVSTAENDRFLNIWELKSSPEHVDGGLLASIALADQMRHVSIDPNATLEQQLLLGVTSSGSGAIYQMPMTKVQPKTPISPRSSLRILSGSSVRIELLAGAFIPRKDGILRIALLAGGIKVLLEDISFRDESGQFIEDVIIDKISINSDILNKETISKGPVLRRYQEKTGFAVGSGYEVGIEDPSRSTNEGVLDVDMAELSLGQRLTVATPTLATPLGVQDSVNSAMDRDGIPTSSLARTLTQALHSFDSRLLELCLAHSDPNTIQNTVERLSPQFALPLLTACVERLGRGHRGTNLKGGGGGASSQRGMSLIAWVRAVLIVHSGHLMAMPDLVARLSGLHALLTSRLAMHDRLLGLSGRLDLVLTQMELRSSNRPAHVTPVKTSSESSKANLTTAKYREGESSDETDSRGPELNELEILDEEGSVEDIEFTAADEVDENDSEEGSEGVVGDENGRSDTDSDAPTSHVNRMNGFVDGEAEEWSGSESSSDDTDE